MGAMASSPMTWAALAALGINQNAQSGGSMAGIQKGAEKAWQSAAKKLGF